MDDANVDHIDESEETNTQAGNLAQDYPIPSSIDVGGATSEDQWATLAEWNFDHRWYLRYTRSLAQVVALYHLISLRTCFV